MLEYIKTFALLAVFIFLSIGCIVNIIRGRDERKENRRKAKEEKKRLKEAKKQAKLDKKIKMRTKMMGVELLSETEEKEDVVREYDLDPEEAEKEYAELEEEIEEN